MVYLSTTHCELKWCFTIIIIYILWDIDNGAFDDVSCLLVIIVEGTPETPVAMSYWCSEACERSLLAFFT